MNQKKVLIITDIIETKERSIQVVLAETGKPCWLPRRLAEFYPGRVVLPMWLADKILRKKGKMSDQRDEEKACI